MGAIAGAVLEVLGESGEPMRPRDVHLSVERQLHQSVCASTVGSFLSVAARNPSMPVVRTATGLYALAGRVASNKAGA
jgi:hypothetical protein